MKKILVLIFLPIFILSCKENKKFDSLSEKDDKYENRVTVELTKSQNLKDCITFKDTINIKNVIKSFKKDLQKMTEKDLKLKYKLEKEIFPKDKIAIVKTEEELYFEEAKNDCLNLTVYFNYNFSKDKGDNSWKGEHQTIMKIVKFNNEIIIKSIIHL